MGRSLNLRMMKCQSSEKWGCDFLCCCGVWEPSCASAQDGSHRLPPSDTNTSHAGVTVHSAQQPSPSINSAATTSTTNAITYTKSAAATLVLHFQSYRGTLPHSHERNSTEVYIYIHYIQSPSRHTTGRLPTSQGLWHHLCVYITTVLTLKWLYSSS